MRGRGEVLALMRILQVTTMYYPEMQFGGPPQKIHDLSRGLVDRGHAVRVVTIHSRQRRAENSFQVDGVSVRYLPWIGRAPWQMPLQWTTIWRSIREADIIHCYGLYNLLCPAAAMFALVARRPFILEPLGMYGLRGRKHIPKRVYNALFTSWMIRLGHRVIATSDMEAGDLRQAVRPDRLVIRRNGIDVTSFKDLPARGEFKRRLELPATGRIVLYVGRISPIKNLEALVQAFHDAALPDITLVLVGPQLEPDYKERLDRRITSLGMQGAIRMTGPLFGRDKLCALADADLFVLPSEYESFGNAAAEAVAAGIPVLLTENCGIAPLIHGRAGLAVAMDVASLSTGLKRMMAADILIEKFRDGCHDVAQEISWDAPLLQMETIYQDALQSKPRQHKTSVQSSEIARGPIPDEQTSHSSTDPLEHL